MVTNGLSQNGMRLRAVVNRASPLKLQSQLSQRIRHAPRTARKSSDRATDRKVESLDESHLNATGEAGGAYCLPIGFRCPEIDMLADFGHALASITLDHLGIQQLRVDWSMATPLTRCLLPL